MFTGTSIAYGHAESRYATLRRRAHRVHPGTRATSPTLPSHGKGWQAMMSVHVVDWQKREDALVSYVVADIS